MRRCAAVLLSAFWLALCGQAAFGQTIATINSASPTSVPAGSGDTTLTLTMRQSGTTKYNVCFYSGVSSTPITPSAYNFQNANAVTYTLTVPGARFQTGGGAYTNSVYLISSTATNGCTGTNAGVSNIFSYSTTAVSYTISSASPSTTAVGSGATSITFTGTFPTFPSNGTGLGLCFYNGTSSTPLLPTSQSGTTSATFSVPYTDFSTAGTAKVYLASDTSTCTGVNPGYSNALSYTVTQSISSSSPSPIPAGNGSTQVSLYGTFSGTSANVCFYTGTTSSLITPTTFNSYEVVFTVPAASLSLPPSSFTSGTYNAKVYFGPAGAVCNGTNPGISNTFIAPISYPQLTSSSIATIPQINPALAAYAPIPSRLELFGNAFASGVYGTFTPNAGSSVTEGASAVIDGSRAVVTIPSLSSSATSTSVNVCNNNGTYQYCSTTPLTITNYALATSATQLASNPASPTPGSSPTLTATITPGSGSSTAGGTYVPGPPTGTVTFNNNGTSLGTAPLTAGSLSLSNASSQVIDVNAGDDAVPVTGGGDAVRAKFTTAGITRPNETPSPDNASQFSSLVADFNQDGLPDVLVIQPSTGIMHLYLGGSPLGTLQSEITIYSAQSCSSLSGVTVADFNGDGFPDLAYLCGSSGGEAPIVIALNNGDGTFPDYGTYSVLGVYGTQIAAADVNKDGKMDLVVTGPTNATYQSPTTYGIQTYFGDGTGNFTLATTTATTDIPGTQIVLKDLNNDGVPDLALLHYKTSTSSTEVSIFQGASTGAFTAITTIPVCNCTTTTAKLFVTPLTTSSLYPDITVAFPDTPSVITALNKRTPTLAFAAPATQTLTKLNDAIVGDFNGDGFADLAYYTGTTTYVASGNGTGNFTLNPNFQSFFTGTGVQTAISLAAAPDLNLDGYADFLAIRPLIEENTTTIESYITTGTASASLTTSGFTTSGSHNLTTTYTGNRDLLGSAGSLSVPITQTTPTINWTPPATTTTTTPVTTFLNATAVDPSTGAAVPGSFAYTYTPSNGTYLSAGTQTITATFTPTNTSTYSSNSASHSITVNKVTPTITTTINPGNHAYQPNLATTYSASVTGTNIVPTGTVQFNSGGSPIGTATGLNQSGTNQSSTAITFASLPANSYVFTGTYQGDAVYNAVTSSATNYTVSQSTPTVTYSPTPTTITYGTALVASQLNATAVDPNTGAALTGNFTYSTAGFSSLQTGSVLPAGSNVITASFAPSDSQDYASANKTATISVSTATTTTAVTVSPTTIAPGQSVLLSVTVTPNPNNTAVTGVVTFSDDNGTIPNAQVTLSNGSATRNYTPSNVGTHRISAAYAGTVNYSPSTSATPASFTVTQKTPTITYSPSPNSITYGTGLVASQLNATAVDPSIGAAVPGVFTYTTSAGAVQTGSILRAGSNTITATFSPTDTATYTTSALAAVITVAQATPTVTYTANPAAISYGTALAAGLFNASASVPGSFSYNPALGTVLPAGSNPVTLTFTPTDTTDYTAVTKSAQVTVTQFTPVIVWSTPASIPYGTPLSSTQLNAVANDINGTAVPGTFSYNPAAGTVLSVGTTNDTVTFTPTNTINFAVATATRTITVTAASTTTTLSVNPASINLGQSTTLTATVTPTTGSGPATGSVTFTDNSGTIPSSTVTLSNGTATLTYTPATSGTHLISASYSGATAYGSSATLTPSSLAVSQGTPVITFAPNPATIPYGTPLSAAQLDAVQTTSIPGVFSYSSPLGTVLPVGANNITATFTPTDTTNYATVTKTATVTVTQFTPVISWATPASIPFGTALSSTQLNAVANDINGVAVPGTYSYNPAAGFVLPVGTTQDTLTFTPTNTTNFATATATRTITVVAAPTTTALAINPGTITLGQSTTLTATVTPTIGTATVTGSVTFTDNRATIPNAQVTLTNGVATLTYTPTANGTHAITATFSGSANYAASSGIGTLAVGQGLPVITFAPNPATIVYGTPLSAAQLDAVQTTSIPGAFSYSSPLGAILPVGANIITATFTPNDTVNYATVTKTATVTVTQATPTITWNPPAATTTNTPLDSTILNATASVPGTFAYTPAAGSYLSAGTQTLNLLFTPADNTNYQTASATRTIAVSKAASTPIVLTANPASQTGPNLPTVFTASIPGTNLTPTGIVQLFEGSNLLGSSNVTQATGHNGIAAITVSTLASGTHNIFASFAGDSVYNGATSNTLAYLVGGATVPITFTPNPASIPYGTPLSAAQLDATTTVPGTFAYSPVLNTILNAGVSTITATFTPTDTATYATTTKTATVTVTQFTPVIVWNFSNIVLYGTALSSAQLDAVANDINGTAVPGTYTYNPAAGTILPSGASLLTLNFTPTNTQNFTPATATRPITLVQPTTATALNINPASITLGQSTTLTASVTDTAGATPVSGQVTFLDSYDTIGMVTLANGIATLTYTPTTIGTHPIVAIFSGTNFYGSSATGNLAVGQGLPVITFAPNPATIPYGTPLSAAQLDATSTIPGVFTYSSPLATILPVGANTLTATFTPTDTINYTTATKTAVITVTSATSALTLAVTANGAPVATVISGSVVTLTATLTTAGTSPVYGQVNFCDTNAATCTGNNIIGSAQLTGNETATYRFIPAVGGHTYKAVFLGNKNAVASTSAASPLLVSGTFPTTTTFTTTGSTGNFTLTAVVTGTGSPTASPTGTVSFLDTSNANAPLATATLGSAATTEMLPQSADTYELPEDSPGVLATGDFNGDGITDILADSYDDYSSTGSKTIVLLGQPDGTFKTTNPSGNPNILPFGSDQPGLVVADFNHDGNLDFAVINQQFTVGQYGLPNRTGTNVVVSLGNGDGTFTQKTTLAQNEGTTIAVGDVNNDGILDLVVGNSVHLGVGDGTFASAVVQSQPPSGSLLALADLNNDGKLDMLVRPQSTQVSVLFGNGDGTFRTQDATLYDTGFDVLSAVVADLNNDSILDLVLNTTNLTPGNPTNDFRVLLGQGDGTFTYKSSMAVNNIDYPSASVVADFDRDGIPDIAFGSAILAIYHGAGDGTFSQIPSTVQSDISLSALAVGDFNGDGLPDFAAIGLHDYFQVFTYKNTFVTSATVTATNVSPIGAGSHAVVASYPGDTNFTASTSAPVSLTGATLTPVLTWTPAPLTYGTPLGAAQLNAVARNASGNLIPGAFVYTPAAGAILPVGRQPLSVTFTPTDLVTYTVATLATTVQVNALSTATALTSSANPAAFAATINLIATITPVGGSSTTPITGSVTFLEGTTQLGTAQVANGTATLPISTLSVSNHLLTAVYSGDTAGNYLTSTSTTLTQVINSTTPTITWTPNPATIIYGTRLTAAQLDAVAKDVTGATLPGTFTYNPAAGAILTAGTQTLNVTFTPTDTVHYITTTATAVLTVTRATPTIVWNTPAAINQGTPLSAAQLNATATGIDGLTLPGTFAYNPAAGALLTAGTQTLNVTFTPTDATDYVTNTASVTLTILNPTTATVLTSSVNPSQFGQPTVLTATIAIPVRGTAAPSGNVTFFDGQTQIGTPAPITVISTGASATLTVATLGVGTHQLTAVYANDPNYVTSTSLPLTQTITIAPVTLSWTPTVATIPYGTPLTSAQLNAVPVSLFVPNVSGLLTYSPTAGTILSAGTQTLNAAFTPTDTTDFLSAAGSTVITVTQATPTLTWPTPAPIAQGTALSATQLNATATGINGQSLPGTYIYTPAAGTVLQAGVTTLRVLFTPTDTVNYTTATATVPLTVSIPGTVTTLVSSLNPSQSGQSVTFTANVVQTGTSTQPLTGTVTFYDSAAALATAPLTASTATFTTSTLSVATHKIRAVYNGTADYATSSAIPVQQVVTAATTRITWTPNPASIVYGTALSAAQLDAVASSATAATIPGTYTYTPAAGAILTAGTQTLSVTFTPTDTVNFTSATATTTITVTRATPTLAWTTPAAITQGIALSATQLNATAHGTTNAALAGVFTYTPPAGTILPSGVATLSVLFTPADTIDYTTATTTVPLTVSIPTANITLASLTNPSQYGQPTVLTATVTPGGTLTAIPTGNVNFFDGTKLLGASPLNALGAATLPISTLTAGAHTLTAAYAGDTANAAVTSAPLTQTVNKAPAILTFAPNPATIVYGTALTAAQLNATATTTYISNVPGTFVYTPALGAVLTAGVQTLSVTFTPTDTANFSATTQTATLTVSKATPTVVFSTPAPVAVGTVLSATQLAATATGVTGSALPGIFTYTPAAGTTVTSGPQTLTVLFTPTDAANYTTATATTTLNGTPVTLTSLSSTTASLGDPAKTITLTGTGFVSDSVARSNGVGLPTTYVNQTTLTAILPAASFRTVQTLQITVNNPTQSQTTSALPFTVSAPAVVIQVNAPTTANPGDQPTITSALATAYPVDVTGTFTLTFAPVSGGVVDPAIQFSTGGTTSTFTIPAGQTTNPNLQIQTGTVAGTITVHLTLSAGGVDVTPAGLAPLVITVPTIAPTVTSVTLVRNGRQLTVRTLGFSNTREVTKATFHFTPATGQQIQTQDVTVDVSAIFAGWYSQTASAAYGSTFLYTQTFTLDDDASVVGQVTVTLGNSVGASASGSSQ